MRKHFLPAFFAVLLISSAFAQTTPSQSAPAGNSKPTVADAEAFMKQAETRLNNVAVLSNRASWVQENFITDDTEILGAYGQEQLIALTTELIQQAKRFDGLDMPPELARKFKLLRLSLTLPAPSDPAERAELTRLATWLDSAYGKGRYCPRQPIPGEKDKCLDITAIERIMATNRNPKVLRDLWVGWHTVSPPFRPKYVRFVELANKGARELGFSDMGALWRSNYDMPPEQFSAEVERLWNQVRPLYLALHTYVRTRLSQRYGPSVVPPDGMIPADLLGNPWAQEWGNIYPLVAPANTHPAYDLDELLKAKHVDALGMVHYGENFFKSLAFGPLPQTFWERSLFTKPPGRDVVCHASAWDIDNKEDVRLKVCLQPRADD